ncbi:hypothetical protein FOZ63_003173, partial [Perkinsus olseni]
LARSLARLGMAAVPSDALRSPPLARAFAGLITWYSMPHPESSARSGAAVRRVGIGTQPLKRHHRRLAFFFAVKIVAPSIAAPGSLAIGETLTPPEDIREKLVERRRRASLCTRSSHCMGLLKTFRAFLRSARGQEDGLDYLARPNSASGVERLIFLDGSFAAIECLSSVPQRDSVPVCPIIEESAEATQ